MYCIIHVVLLSFSLLHTLWAYETVCYWDATSKYREERFGMVNLKKSMLNCDSLIVGFLGLKDITLEIPNLTRYQTKVLHKVVDSKRDGSKVFLGIGASVYHNWNMDTYDNLLKREELRKKLVESVTRLAVQFDMDGIDLTWPFSPSPSSGNVKKLMTQKLERICRKLLAKPRRTSHEELEVSACLGEEGPENAIRDAFTNLTLSLSASLENVTKDLSLTVLPRTNVDYYDVPSIVPALKTIHLLTFDYVTPLTQPELADYTAPLYDSNSSTSGSVDATIRTWEDAGTPKDKIVMGIPTFGRSWKIMGSVGPDQCQAPPLSVEMPGEGVETAYGHVPGLEPYDRVCGYRGESFLVDKKNNTLILTEHHHVDTEMHRGSYQYWKKNTVFPTSWSTYEDEQIIIAKVKYMKARGLAGVGIYDLSFDDTFKICDHGSVLGIARTSLTKPLSMY